MFYVIKITHIKFIGCHCFSSLDVFDVQIWINDLAEWEVTCDFISIEINRLKIFNLFKLTSLVVDVYVDELAMLIVH